MKTFFKSRAGQILWKTAVVLLWILVWQLAYLKVGRDLLLASPVSVLRRLVDLAGTAPFWATIGRSLSRVMTGFLLGTAAGGVLGILTSHCEPARDMVKVPMTIMKATPVASFVILALVWLSGRNLSVFICFLMVMPMVWSSVDEGLGRVDKPLLETAKVFHLPLFTRIRVLSWPAVRPYLFSSLRVALGYAWKAGIAGEVIAIPRGTIGTELYHAKIYLETTDLFTWTLVIILLSLLIEKVMTWLFDKLGGKEETQS